MGQDDENEPDRKRASFDQRRIRRSNQRPQVPITGTPHGGMLASIGKRLRMELNSNTTPMPLRILLVALRLMPPENPATKSTVTPPAPGANVPPLPPDRK